MLSPVRRSTRLIPPPSKALAMSLWGRLVIMSLQWRGREDHCKRVRRSISQLLSWDRLHWSRASMRKTGSRPESNAFVVLRGPKTSFEKVTSTSFRSSLSLVRFVMTLWISDSIAGWNLAISNASVRQSLDGVCLLCRKRKKPAHRCCRFSTSIRLHDIVVFPVPGAPQSHKIFGADLSSNQAVIFDKRSIRV